MENKVRLQKHLADRGLCSRREAESWITDGIIRVNGKVAVLGTKVDPENDHIVLGGRRLKQIKPQETGKKIILAMNKPRGVLCSNSDPHHAQTIFDLLPGKYTRYRLFCVGRLDKDSEGLIILTNDGELSNRITHPKYGIVKRYQVILSKPFDPKIAPLLIKGVNDDGEHLCAEKVTPATSGLNFEKRVEVHLRQGKNREIRRLFRAFTYRIHRLKRTQIGQFKLKQIAKGGIKDLTKKEIELLLS